MCKPHRYRGTCWQWIVQYRNNFFFHLYFHLRLLDASAVFTGVMIPRETHLILTFRTHAPILMLPMAHAFYWLIFKQTKTSNIMSAAPVTNREIPLSCIPMVRYLPPVVAVTSPVSLGQNWKKKRLSGEGWTHDYYYNRKLTHPCRKFWRCSRRISWVDRSKHK